MGWISGPVSQDPKTTWTWFIWGFSQEPGGVVVTAEALGDGTTVTSTNSGSHQPTYAEAQQNQNPYKVYQVDVTTGPVPGYFWLKGIG